MKFLSNPRPFDNETFRAYQMKYHIRNKNNCQDQHWGHSDSTYAQKPQKIEPPSLPPCTQLHAFGFTHIYENVLSVYSHPFPWPLLTSFYSDSSFRHSQFLGYFYFLLKLVSEVKFY